MGVIMVGRWNYSSTTVRVNFLIIVHCAMSLDLPPLGKVWFFYRVFLSFSRVGNSGRHMVADCSVITAFTVLASG